MNRQQSFGGETPSLYLIPTPIGNLSEFSPRAIEVLQNADIIACEDTRTSGQLLKHFNISHRLIAYQNFNEESSAKGILQLLSEGNNVALISDAGYPLISDPGQRVVPAAIEAGYNVIPISGPSAFLDALVASGLIVQPFIFLGFLPANKSEARQKLQKYEPYPMTLVFYEAPHRIQKTLQNCLEILGDRPCCLARELTKIHEEFLRGTLSEVLANSEDLKGEMVLIIAGKDENAPVDIDRDQILLMVKETVDQGYSNRDAIKQVAVRTGISKNEIYRLVHEKGETD